MTFVAPPPAADEEARLRALHAYAALDTPPDERLDELVRAASAICGVPISLVSLVDRDRQYFKANVGLAATETPRDVSFCGHAILHRDLFIVSDALEDDRFRDNPLVLGDPNVRFYAGMPLVNPEGRALGTLCVIDHQPRQLDAEQEAALRLLARRAVRVLESLKPRNEPAAISPAPASEPTLGWIGLAALTLALSALAVAAEFGLTSRYNIVRFHRIGEAIVLAVLVAALVAARLTLRRREVSQRLAQSERQFATAVIESASSVLVVLDRSGRVERLNHAAEQTLGIDLRDALGQPLDELCELATDSGLTSERLAALDSADLPLREDSLVRTADGRGVTLSWSLTAVLGPGGIEHLVLSGIDLTERREIEDALRASEQRWQLTLEGSRDGAWDWNMRTDRVFYSRYFEQILGYSPGEIGPSPNEWRSRLHPEDREACYEKAHRHFRGETDFYESEHRLLAKDGQYVWVRERGRVIEREASGEPARMVGTLDDVSQRRQTTAELARLTQRQRAILDGANYSIISTDPDGKIVEFNRGAERMLGYPASEVIGKTTPGIFHDAEEVATYAKQLTSELDSPVQPGFEAFVARTRLGSADEREWTYIRKNGSRLPVRLSVTALRDDAGLITGFLGVAEDLTERNEAERELRAEEERTRAIVDSLQEGLLVIDREGGITRANPAAARKFSAEQVVLLGRPIGELLYLVGDQQAVDSATLRQGAGKVAEYLARRRDGGWFPVEVLVGELDNNGLVLSLRDISERRQVEALKRSFIATVSHELRTPLTSIRGALGLVVGGAAGAIPARAASLLEIAYKNSERLGRLINDILDVERIEDGKMELKMSPLEVTPLLTHAIAANQGYGAQHGVRLALVGDLPAAVVLGDADRLAQVLDNLISNAIKFSPKKELVEVGICLAAGRVRIEVHDRGPGIPASFRQRMFSKFAQVDSTDARARGGSGLGLSIARAIAERHGGVLDFIDREGGGTTFFLELPRIGQPAAGAPFDGQKAPRILVCEDDPDVAEVLRTILAVEGYQVTVVACAEDARVLLVKGGFAALTLDLGLPGQDGLALVRELRQNPATERLPIIVVSAQSRSRRGELTASGINLVEWLEKPLSPIELRHALHQAIFSLGGEKLSILHVEDDGDLREIVAGVVGELGEVVAAASLEDARQLLVKRAFQLVLLDLGLPDGSGIELLGDLAESSSCAAPVVVFSAGSIEVAPTDRVACWLIKSQTSNEELLQVVRRLIPREEPVSVTVAAAGSAKRLEVSGG